MKVHPKIKKFPLDYYLYIESSGLKSNDYARLISKTLSKSFSTTCMIVQLAHFLFVCLLLVRRREGSTTKMEIKAMNGMQRLLLSTRVFLIKFVVYQVRYLLSYHIFVEIAKFLGS